MYVFVLGRSLIWILAKYKALIYGWSLGMKRNTLKVVLLCNHVFQDLQDILNLLISIFAWQWWTLCIVHVFYEEPASSYLETVMEEMWRIQEMLSPTVFAWFWGISTWKKNWRTIEDFHWPFQFPEPINWKKSFHWNV